MLLLLLPGTVSQTTARFEGGGDRGLLVLPHELCAVLQTALLDVDQGGTGLFLPLPRTSGTAGALSAPILDVF